MFQVILTRDGSSEIYGTYANRVVADEVAARYQKHVHWTASVVDLSHLKPFTPSELEWLAATNRETLPDTLRYAILSQHGKVDTATREAFPDLYCRPMNLRQTARLLPIPSVNSRKKKK